MIRYAEALLPRLVRRRFLPLALVLITTACSNSNPSTTTSPTPTAPPTLTETLQGVLTPNGAATYYFPVLNPGAVTAALVNMSPDSTIILGLSLGIWNGTSCNVILANDQATQGSVIAGNLSAPGNLCVRIYDSQGNVVNPEGYQINATHP